MQSLDMLGLVFDIGLSVTPFMGHLGCLASHWSVPVSLINNSEKIINSFGLEKYPDPVVDSYLHMNVTKFHGKQQRPVQNKFFLPISFTVGAGLFFPVVQGRVCFHLFSFLSWTMIINLLRLPGSYWLYRERMIYHQAGGFPYGGNSKFLV